MEETERRMKETEQRIKENVRSGRAAATARESGLQQQERGQESQEAIQRQESVSASSISLGLWRRARVEEQSPDAHRAGPVLPLAEQEAKQESIVRDYLKERRRGHNRKSSKRYAAKQRKENIDRYRERMAEQQRRWRAKKKTKKVAQKPGTATAARKQVRRTTIGELPPKEGAEKPSHRHEVLAAEKATPGKQISQGMEQAKTSFGPTSEITRKQDPQLAAGKRPRRHTKGERQEAQRAAQARWWARQKAEKGEDLAKEERRAATREWSRRHREKQKKEKSEKFPQRCKNDRKRRKAKKEASRPFIWRETSLELGQERQEAEARLHPPSTPIEAGGTIGVSDDDIPKLWRRARTEEERRAAQHAANARYRQRQIERYGPVMALEKHRAANRAANARYRAKWKAKDEKGYREYYAGKNAQIGNRENAAARRERQKQAQRRFVQSQKELHPEQFGEYATSKSSRDRAAAWYQANKSKKEKKGQEQKQKSKRGRKSKAQKERKANLMKLTMERKESPEAEKQEAAQPSLAESMS